MSEMKKPDHPENQRTAIADLEASVRRSTERLLAEQQARQDAERTAQRMARLQAVTASLSEAVLPSQVVKIIIEQGTDALGAHTGTAALLSSDGTELETVYSLGASEQFTRAWQRFAVDAPVPLAEAVRTGQPILLPSQQDLRARYPLLASVEIPSQTFAVIPLSLPERTIGALCFSFLEPNASDEDDMAFLLTLGRLCTQALERAEFYAAAQREVAERQRAEQALQASEQRFRALVENSSDAVVIVNAEGILIYASPPARGILGYAPEEFLGRNPFILIHPDDQARITAAFQRLVQQPNATVKEQHRVRHKNGDWIWVDSVGTNLLHDPNVQGVVINYRDITERKRHEEEMRFVLAGAHCLLWYAEVRFIGEDLPLDWHLWFPDEAAARRFLNVTVSEDQSFVEVWHLARPAEDRARIDAHARQEILAGRSYRQQYCYYRSDGALRWLAEEAHVETVASGNWRIVGVCTDITELKGKEQEIQALYGRLQRAMAETHHRVKNNLQVISALIEIQMEEGEQTVSVDALKRVRQHITTLAGIHDLLTREARAIGDAQRLSVKVMLSKLIPLVQETLSGRRITWQVADIYLPVREGTALALLINELVSNSIKHGDGNIRLTLTVSEDTVRLEICDDGPGFPPDFDAKLAANTGLDLVESVGRWDLQGEITYENREQGGGRVVVTFPLDARR